MFQPGFGERPTAKDVVILLTDGQSNINYFDTIPSATALKEDGITVLGIGIGLKDAVELQNIASGPQDVFQVATFDALDDIKAEIVAVSAVFISVWNEFDLISLICFLCQMFKSWTSRKILLMPGWNLYVFSHWKLSSK